jgi:hypothetical protein
MLKKNYFFSILMMLMCLGGFHTAEAQTVTVSGLSGSSISKNDSRVYNAMWRHKQAPLTIQTANDGDEAFTITRSNLAFSENANKYLECYNFTGHQKCLIRVELPKGFRFTDYQIVIKRGGYHHSGYEGTFHDNTGQSYLYETNSNFSTTTGVKETTNLGTKISTSTPTYKMSRQSTGSSDMGNVLYFVYYVENGGSQSQGITFQKFQISFAPDVDITTPMAPASTFATAKDSIWSPFRCGKYDFGEFSYNADKNMYGYKEGDTKEMSAFNTLYQSDCYDATGKYTGAADKGITAIESDGKYYYGLSAHTYYAECATFAKERYSTPDGYNVPVGYRITGANIYYAYEKANEVISIGDTYSNVDNIFSTNYGDKWILFHQAITDKSSWYATNSSYNGAVRSLGTPSDADLWCFVGNSTKFTIYNKAAGQNYQLGRAEDSYNNGTAVNLYASTATDDSRFLWQILDYTSARWPGYDIAPAATNTTAINLYNGRLTDNLALHATGTSIGGNHWIFQAANITTAPSTDYTLTVYTNNAANPDLTAEYQTVDVKADTKADHIELRDLNNDAIKFDISNMSNPNGKALVYVDLILQPLNPYVKEMSVGYEPGGNTPAITKYVNSYDFNFGDNVQLSIPSTYKTTNAQGYQITFNYLKSNYGDKTYYDNSTSTEKSRYSFVKSDYYNTHEDVYATKATVATSTYEGKIKTIQAGDKPFTYSNIAKVAPTLTSGAQYLEEYQFSLATYMDKQKDGGSFDNRYLKIGDQDTYYLFVTDEPQFNIAPSILTEHRAYNYYQVTVTAKQLNELPKLTWKKIYDKPFYNEQQDASYFSGVSVAAKHATPNGDGTLTITDLDGEGYLSADDIITQMKTDITTNVTDAPADMAHVLYIDASNLISVITTKDANKVGSWSRLQPNLAKNTLLFLPENTSTNFVNAVIKDGDTYKACANIVLTDKQPFYTPYDFYLGGGNYATYTRLFSGNNGKVKKATVMLPFAISLNEGTHTNEDGKCSFSVYSMKDGYAFTNVSLTNGGVEGTDYYAADAQFVKLTDAQTTANTPYYVEVTNTNDNNSSFVATQYGASFVATPDAALYNKGNGRISSDKTCTGTIEGTSYTFTNTATYAGETLAVATNYVFYFGTDKFYSLQNFSTGYGYVNPFRGYYSYPKPAGAKSIYLSEFGVNTDGNTTDISSVTPKPSMMVSTGKGYIDIQTNNPTDISIYTLSGQCVRQDALAGSTNTRIALPKGFYIVNGAKVIVK